MLNRLRQFWLASTPLLRLWQQPSIAFAAKQNVAYPHSLLLLALTSLDGFAAYSRAAFYKSEDADLARRNLARLIELVITLEDKGLTNLPALVERLGVVAASDEMGNAVGPRSGVTLMTIHKAKGLEFPCVAVMDTGRPWGKRDLYWAQTEDDDGRPGLRYVGTRAEQPLADPEFLAVMRETEDAVVKECQRLLYVALTRPRQYLLLSAHEPNRSQGLASTIVYGQFDRALSAPPLGRASSTEEINGIAVREWYSIDDDARREAASATAPMVSQVPPSPWSGITPNLPREWVITAPSRHEVNEDHEGRSGVRLSAEMSPRLAAAVGTFLHRGLEAFMRRESFSAEAIWCQTVPPGAEGASWRKRIATDLGHLLTDPQLHSLRDQAAWLETELPLALQRGAELMLGSLDLLVADHDGGLMIIDYKSTRFAGSEYDIPTLQAFCHERGYDEQLDDYASAVSALHPGSQLKCCVYFTTLRRLVDLPHSGAAPSIISVPKRIRRSDDGQPMRGTSPEAASRPEPRQ